MFYKNLFSIFILIILILCMFSCKKYNKNDNNILNIVSEEKQLDEEAYINNTNNYESFLNNISNDNNLVTFESLPYGVSVNDGKKILEVNRYVITNERVGKYDSGDDYCHITIKGIFNSYYCNIEYIFMNDHFITGYYIFNIWDFDYTKDNLEEIKNKIVLALTENFKKEPKNYQDTVYDWELDNNIQVRIMQNIIELDIIYMGFNYLNNMK